MSRLNLGNEDQLAAVDARFLGPRGWSLPVKPRYSSLGIGFGLFLVLLVLAHTAGVLGGFGGAVVLLLAACYLTTLTARLITPERPARCLAVTFAHEVGGPREPKGTARTYCVRRLHP